MGKALKTIFTDQDHTIPKPIEKVSPETKHRLCIWHIPKDAAQHIPHLLSKQKFKEIFCSRLLHRCESVDEFESTWIEMIRDGDLASYKWLNRLYELHHKWSPVFSYDAFSVGIRSTQRSESTNNFFQDITNTVIS